MRLSHSPYPARGRRTSALLIFFVILCFLASSAVSRGTWPPGGLGADSLQRCWDADDSSMAYNNALLTLSGEATPDPFVKQAFGQYYLIFTSGDHVEIWSSESILGFDESCEKTEIW